MCAFRGVGTLKKRKQWDYKPGSVSLSSTVIRGRRRWCLPFIYGVTLATSLSFYPPARTGRPFSPLHDGSCSRCVAGLRELSTSGVHSTPVARRLVSSYLTFSPLPAVQIEMRNNGRRLFSSAPASPRGLLSVR